MSQESDISCTPPEILNLATTATENLLPSKSKGKYDVIYKKFLEWRLRKNTTSFSESVVLVYFTELAKKYKSSSLWAYYSMLKSTLNIYHNINIENYKRLQVFLKRQSEGHRPKKAKTFTPEEVHKFINEAPDDIYLLTKPLITNTIIVVCDIAYTELNLVFTKTKTARSFTISGEFYMIVKKYLDLRPPNPACHFLFLNYQRGKCTIQRVGINKLAAMGKQIALFLNLKDAQLYTGHTFRRSSATICVSGGGDILDVKKIGGWKFTAVAEGYIDDNINNKLDRGNTILQQINKTAISDKPSKKPCTITSSSTNNNCSNSNNNTSIIKHYELADNTARQL
ncbi:hypothetical protein NQ315_002696 [Exocentrus adspersus]|uniref:Tyr recombinase domain-containing protein n=1 Tax=Exocentrus adspersus TaxID=1586481 RepID=A0AAV8VII3_9CUCU|nr:hypothetical protein NQ315_002696 [Exocentrus adspersus]